MSELDIFLRNYEQATNSHDFSKIKPLIAENSVYWFSDGSFEGLNAIQKAFEETWDKIQNEIYSIRNVRWISIADNQAVCVYEFHWTGKIEGKKLRGVGRGTNVISKTNGKWRMLHEHLSKNS